MAKEELVNRILLAGALAVSAALIMPGFAQTPAPPASPQATPTPAATPEAPGGGEPEQGGRWMHGEGGWGMRGMMMHHGMGRDAGRWNPQQRCIDRLAWRAARRAYVETELNLTAAQRPLWDRLQNIAQSEQQRERQFCAQLKPQAELTVLDRMDRAQQFLSARLDALQAAKPAVQALYQALTPEQREIFDHPFRRD